MRTNWSGSLNHAVYGEILKACPLVIARYIFAGYTAISNKIINQDIINRIRLNINKEPNKISKKPLI